jgi:exodeoxyribonuclease VII large subunit
MDAVSGPAPALRVSELCAEIRSALTDNLGTFWVVGEIQRLRPSQRGHVYFELIEKDAQDGIIARLDAVIWKGDFLRVRQALGGSGQQLREGLEIRCRGQVDFWPPGGRLQLVVREVDPIFTLGLLEQRRRETLAALARQGLLELNRQLEIPLLPLRVGLITSQGSAAYHDFLSGLGESGYGFRVTFVHASVQGAAAEGEIASALELLNGLADSLDVLVLIRGGGSRSDLAVFDSRRVAEAIARCRLPVLTGLGHEIDQSIADAVAHTPLKTPTKAAEFLVEALAEADLEVTDLGRRLVREAREPLLRGARRLERAEKVLALASARLDAAVTRLEHLGRLLIRLAQNRLQAARSASDGLASGLAQAAPRSLSRLGRRPVETQQRILAVARGRVARDRATVEGLERLCRQLAPERTLDRGFSITRGASGELLRDARRAAPGSEILTQLASGSLRSRVETAS